MNRVPEIGTVSIVVEAAAEVLERVVGGRECEVGPKFGSILLSKLQLPQGFVTRTGG